MNFGKGFLAGVIVLLQTTKPCIKEVSFLQARRTV